MAPSYLHMRVLNFRAQKFAIGKKVVAVQQYISGNIFIDIGEVGEIVGEAYHDLPDLNMFNIRVIDIDFGLQKISLGEAVAEMFVEPL